MAKKMERVAVDRIPVFVGNSNPLNIITKAGSVFMGTVISTNGEILNLKNTRGKKQSLHLREIEEIWAEKPA